MADPFATDTGGSSSGARPADDVLEAVHSACRRLYAVEDEFARNFRDSLDQLVPSLRHTTADQGATIAEGLARAVLWAGLTPDPPSVVEVTFRNLGAEYGRRGFPASGYHGAGHALLRAARDTQIGEWTSELSSAWVAYYGWLSAHLVADLPTDADPLPMSAAAVRPEPQPGSEPEPTPAAPTPVASEQAPEPAPAAAPAPAPAHLAASLFPSAGGSVESSGGPASLDEALELLRSRYFAGNERALGAILTRVALRTGADLRAPRPDQRTNPAVIANVTAVLQVMGYVLQDGGSEAVQRVISPFSREPATDRWWNRRRSSPPRGWRRSMPGTFR